MTEESRIFEYTVEVRSFGHADTAGRSCDRVLMRALNTAFGAERITVRDSMGNTILMDNPDSQDTRRTPPNPGWAACKHNPTQGETNVQEAAEDDRGGDRDRGAAVGLPGTGLR